MSIAGVSFRPERGTNKQTFTLKYDIKHGFEVGSVNEELGENNNFALLFF